MTSANNSDRPKTPYESPKQRKFFEAYIAFGSSSTAARATGYTPAHGRALISKWRKAGYDLGPDKVDSFTPTHNGEMQPVATRERRLELLTAIAETCDDPHARLKAIDLIAKLAGDYKEPPKRAVGRLELLIGRTTPTPGERKLAEHAAATAVLDVAAVPAVAPQPAAKTNGSAKVNGHANGKTNSAAGHGHPFDWSSIEL